MITKPGDRCMDKRGPTKVRMETVHIQPKRLGSTPKWEILKRWRNQKNNER